VSTLSIARVGATSEKIGTLSIHQYESIEEFP
jgi:hypothetical protein